ncbi:GNAT family N-acetyltransferase [Neobacillus dielmonensis]|uniref:GNAT family N-acetyltransferase n=1 Tax=Neobacillus dielmonensis TaxID=1347369 RepID=UPI0005A77EB1|nr:GNAT family N-acetyltransferase [Neobacillus dielmonensis]
MVEYRLVQEGEFQQAIELADKVFRKEGHVSMGLAFPHVFSSALHQSYGAFIDGKLVSFIGLVPSVLHIEGAEVQAYSIGAVCTEPDYRKRGMANTLLQMIFEHVNQSGASVLFISGDLPLYRKQGCHYYGKMNSYKLHSDDLQKDSKYSIRELQPYDWFQLRKLSQNRPIRYEQSIYELALLNEAAGFASIFKMNHKVLVAEENQEIKAFLVFGMPYQQQDVIDSRVIEWGGDSSAIRTLLGEAFQYGLHSLIVPIPAFDRALNQQLNSLEKEAVPYPGTMKIMNRDLLLKQLDSYFAGKLEILPEDEHHKRLIFEKKSVVISNEELEELILTGNAKLDPYLNELFPIPFPFPQGLNYV